MCEDCGCSEALAGQHIHTHADGTTHSHSHGAPGRSHEHSHAQAHAHGHEDEVRVVPVESRVLAHNDRLAAENRQWLSERKVVAVNLISSPGTGKTLLLEKTLERMQDRVACAVIAGDQQTDHDAQRLRRAGVPVKQIETRNTCHLDAERVGKVLPEVVEEGVTQLLFIENVGNLVCPAAFDLGENFKVALLSTTEGEDKPVKYPTLFNAAQVVVLTKMDLLPHLDWDAAACRRYIQQVHPGVFVFELSARTGDGLDLWCDYLARLVQ